MGSAQAEIADPIPSDRNALYPAFFLAGRSRASATTAVPS